METKINKVEELFIEESDETGGYPQLVAKTNNGEYVIQGTYCGGVPVSYWTCRKILVGAKDECEDVNIQDIINDFYTRAMESTVFGVPLNQVSKPGLMSCICYLGERLASEESESARRLDLILE